MYIYKATCKHVLWQGFIRWGICFSLGFVSQNAHHNNPIHVCSPPSFSNFASPLTNVLNESLYGNPCICSLGMHFVGNHSIQIKSNWSAYTVLSHPNHTCACSTDILYTNIMQYFKSKCIVGSSVVLANYNYN